MVGPNDSAAAALARELPLPAADPESLRLPPAPAPGGRAADICVPIPDREPPIDSPRVAPDVPSEGQLSLDISSATVVPFPASRMREPAPDPAHWARAIVLATFEALHGARAPIQLRRWFAPPVHAALTARAACITRSLATPPRITIHSVRATEVDIGRVETTSVVEVNGRCRAVAMCMQMYDGRWRVTALEIG